MRRKATVDEDSDTCTACGRDPRGVYTCYYCEAELEYEKSQYYRCGTLIKSGDRVQHAWPESSELDYGTVTSTSNDEIVVLFDGNPPRIMPIEGIRFISSETPRYRPPAVRPK